MATSDIKTLQDAVVTAINAAVDTGDLSAEVQAVAKMLPPMDPTKLGVKTHVIVIPGAAKRTRIVRSKSQQDATISVGVIKRVLFAPSAELDQDVTDDLMALVETIADVMSKTSVDGNCTIVPYDQERLKEGFFFARIDADYFTLRDLT